MWKRSLQESSSSLLLLLRHGVRRAGLAGLLVDGRLGEPRDSKTPLIKEYTLNHIRVPIII